MLKNLTFAVYLGTLSIVHPLLMLRAAKLRGCPPRRTAGPRRLAGAISLIALLVMDGSATASASPAGDAALLVMTSAQRLEMAHEASS